MKVQRKKKQKCAPTCAAIHTDRAIHHVHHVAIIHTAASTNRVNIVHTVIHAAWFAFQKFVSVCVVIMIHNLIYIREDHNIHQIDFVFVKVIFAIAVTGSAATTKTTQKPKIINIFSIPYSTRIYTHRHTKTPTTNQSRSPGS